MYVLNFINNNKTSIVTEKNKLYTPLYFVCREYNQKGEQTRNTTIYLKSIVPNLKNDLAHDKPYNMNFVTINDSDQLIHPSSTARALVYPFLDSSNMVTVLINNILHNTCFHMTRFNCILEDVLVMKHFG